MKRVLVPVQTRRVPLSQLLDWQRRRDVYVTVIGMASLALMTLAFLYR